MSTYPIKCKNRPDGCYSNDCNDGGGCRIDAAIEEVKRLDETWKLNYKAVHDLYDQKEKECSRLEKERDEWREHAECRQCTIVNQKDVISRLESENERLQTFIEEGIDRNERFDNAEKQWFERHQKDQVTIENLESENRELKKQIKSLTDRVDYQSDNIKDLSKIINGQSRTLEQRDATIDQLRKETEEAKALLSKADSMYKAFDKTLRQLAADGVALEGFTESLAAVNEFHQAKIESFLKDKTV